MQRFNQGVFFFFFRVNLKIHYFLALKVSMHGNDKSSTQYERQSFWYMQKK
jgi:hypothetical protein